MSAKVEHEVAFSTCVEEVDEIESSSFVRTGLGGAATGGASCSSKSKVGDPMISQFFVKDT